MKRFIDKDKIIIAFFIIIIGIYGFWVNRDQSYKSNKAEEHVSESIENTNYLKTFFYVHIDGEVNQPGLYKLKNNSRIDDVIKEAGGLTEKATTENINLAQKIKDEMKIYIPSVEEGSSEVIINQDSNNNLININLATKEELMTLSGIGEVKAESIIKHRESTKFSQIEDIMNVSGIGEKTFEIIEEEITVN